jgi:hypothetical protein
MSMVVKRIGVWSVARMYGALLAAMGLLFGLMVALFSMVSAGFAGGMQDAPSWIAPVFGVGAIVVLPICYGLMGIVMGAITAVLYNLFAGIVGGVVLETE